VHTCIDVQDASLTIRVTDDGPPIDAEDLSRLLLPLERLAHESRPGLRIGLAVADAAAALIGGGVSVLPRTGDGAIVTARIPLTSPIDGANAPS
jgi:signal transduction histidine kinase